MSSSGRFKRQQARAATDRFTREYLAKRSEDPQGLDVDDHDLNQAFVVAAPRGRLVVRQATASNRVAASEGMRDFDNRSQTVGEDEARGHFEPEEIG